MFKIFVVSILGFSLTNKLYCNHSRIILELEQTLWKMIQIPGKRGWRLMLLGWATFCYLLDKYVEFVWDFRFSWHKS